MAMMKPALIAICVCFAGFAQTRNDLLRYEPFFQLLVDIQHRPANLMPNVQEAIGLTAAETKLLNDTAADYIKQMKGILFEARLQAADSGKPSEAEEQRVQLIRH